MNRTSSGKVQRPGFDPLGLVGALGNSVEI
jgi:hypothetical protein